MSIVNAVSAGLAGNELSKTITGTSEVSAGRTVVASGCGAAVGAVAAGGLAVGAAAIGVAAAPVAIPLAIGGAIFGGIASFFD